jgi:hypothetical protein
VATDVTPALELVPAPIKLLTSAADIPVFKLGTVPLDKIAGVPVSLTTPRLVLAPDAVLDPVPPFATDKSVPDQFPLLILTDPPKVIVPVEVIVPPVNVIPFTVPLVATDVTPCPSVVALIVIVSPDLTVVILLPAAIVKVSLLLFAVAVPPELAVKFLYIACDDPLSVLVKVPVLVIVPPDNPVLVAIDVTPALELVPAPIRLLTSAALIPEFKDGVEPFDKIAGTPCNDAEVIYPAPFVNWLLLVGKPVAVKLESPFLVNVNVPEEYDAPVT